MHIILGQTYNIDTIYYNKLTIISELMKKLTKIEVVLQSIVIFYITNHAMLYKKCSY